MSIVNGLPFVPSKFAEVIFGFGERLMLDDKFDVGHFSYRYRPHYHNGQKTSKHMSSVHHWYLGFPLLILGQMLGAMSEMMQAYQDEDNEPGVINYNDLRAKTPELTERKPLDLDTLMNVY